MKNLVTKKNVFFLALGGCIIFFLSAFQKEIGFCGAVYNNCWDIVDLIWPPLAPVLSLLPLSLATYKMRDEIFAAWVSFAKWWVPLSMIAVLIAPEAIKGSFSVPVKWPLAVFCSATLLVVSLILIARKWFTLRGKK